MTSPDPLDDAVARLREGDEAAFREVYRSVQPALLRYLTSLVGPDEAEDVAAEGWAHAVRDLDRFSGGGDGFRAWLTTICRHRAMDHLRRASRRSGRALDAELDDRASDVDAPTAARILGKRPGAVRTAAHRGLRTLAGRLGLDADPVD